MRRLWLSAALACTLFAAPVNRSLVASVEISMNKRIEALAPGEEFLLLGHTHGVYLEGYGAVFSARVNLAEGPGRNMFGIPVPESARASLHKKKLERLPLLKSAMREMLIGAASVMDPVPVEERIVVSILLANLPHENNTGLPSQIVMQAQRKTLLALMTEPTTSPRRVSEIQVREY